MAKNVLVFCAHSDDQAIGAGGYLAQLAKEGANIRTIIASFGEQSHPHLKRKEIQRIRVLESKKADRILGGNGVMFVGLREGNFLKDYESRDLHEKLVPTITDFRPDLVLTHSVDDPHPDHRAAHAIALRLHADACPKAEMFSFNVWNLFSIRTRRSAKLMVDITPTFKRKLDAISAFKSQRAAVITLLWSVYVKAIFWGWRGRNRYGEVYFKVR